MEVPSGLGTSNDNPHVIVVAPILDDDTNIGFRASEEDGNEGHGPEWTRGLKFHRGCKCREFQSLLESSILI